jgi:hypothetical protein
MPESGIPSHLIDEEDDYAFVGDIAEVKLILSSFLLP